MKGWIEHVGACEEEGDEEQVDDSTRLGEGADDGFRYTRPSQMRAMEGD